MLYAALWPSIFETFNNPYVFWIAPFFIAGMVEILKSDSPKNKQG